MPPKAKAKAKQRAANAKQRARQAEELGQSNEITYPGLRAKQAPRNHYGPTEGPRGPHGAWGIWGTTHCPQNP
jgi:hypothetical protein